MCMLGSLCQPVSCTDSVRVFLRVGEIPTAWSGIVSFRSDITTNSSRTVILIIITLFPTYLTVQRHQGCSAQSDTDTRDGSLPLWCACNAVRLHFPPDTVYLLPLTGCTHTHAPHIPLCVTRAYLQSRSWRCQVRFRRTTNAKLQTC
jgi:hypothetical protein